MGDDTSKTLVVVCMKDMWPEIERIIKEVDEQSVRHGDSKAYALKHSQAVTIAQILQQSFMNPADNRLRAGDGRTQLPV